MIWNIIFFIIDIIVLLLLLLSLTALLSSVHGLIRLALPICGSWSKGLDLEVIFFIKCASTNWPVPVTVWMFVNWETTALWWKEYWLAKRFNFLTFFESCPVFYVSFRPFDFFYRGWKTTWSMCSHIGVCVCEREREREKDIKKDREREGTREKERIHWVMLSGQGWLIHVCGSNCLLLSGCKHWLGAGNEAYSLSSDWGERTEGEREEEGERNRKEEEEDK